MVVVVDASAVVVGAVGAEAGLGAVGSGAGFALADAAAAFYVEIGSVLGMKRFGSCSSVRLVLCSQSLA